MVLDLIRHLSLWLAKNEISYIKLGKKWLVSFLYHDISSSPALVMVLLDTLEVFGFNSHIK